MLKVACLKNGVRAAILLSALITLQIGFVSSARGQSVEPKELYAKAWDTVKQNFYDQSFNGQDWSRWNHHYDRQIETQEDADKAIESMLASLGDPYTRYLNVDAFAEENSQIAARLFGVGMQLAMNKEQKIVVIAPIEGSPAQRAGVRAGDIVSAVNGNPVTGLALDAVVKQIRGPQGTHVSVSFLRGKETIEVPLTRAEIHIKAVPTALMLPDNIGYLRIDSFISKDTLSEVKAALTQLQSADGLIVDLRNNPGGLLTNAIDISSLFLPEGKVVVETDSNGYVTSAKTTGGSMVTDKPLILLVNKGSASASEILAGAMRDNSRAKLVGDTTFGKGLVQAILKLPGGSGVNVTIARYLTPSHKSIHKVGIEPDYKVVLKDWKEESGDAWPGPWWIDPGFSSLSHAPTDGNDIQLRKAIWAIRNQLAVSRGLPPIPEPSMTVAKTGGGRPGAIVALGSESVKKNTGTTNPNIASLTKPSTGTTTTGTGTTPATGTGTTPATAGPAKNRPIGDKWALVIGISHFQNPTLNLKYPAKDAQDIGRFLVSNCHFSADHVKVLTDNNATRAAIMTELGDKWLPRVVKPDDLVLLYFSTHGSPAELDVDDVNYLLAWDSDPDSLFSSGLPMQDLMRVIKHRIRSDRVVVMLDACYSGNVDPRAKGIKRQANINAEDVAQGTGQLVISSSAPNQISWESNRQENSVFTRHLLNALTAGGDKTKLGDAFRILSERVEDEVQRDRGRIQTPMLKSQWVGDELMLAIPPVSPRPGLNAESK